MYILTSDWSGTVAESFCRVKWISSRVTSEAPSGLTVNLASWASAAFLRTVFWLFPASTWIDPRLTNETAAEFLSACPATFPFTSSPSNASKNLPKSFTAVSAESISASRTTLTDSPSLTNTLENESEATEGLAKLALASATSSPSRLKYNVILVLALRAERSPPVTLNSLSYISPFLAV